MPIIYSLILFSALAYSPANAVAQDTGQKSIAAHELIERMKSVDGVTYKWAGTDESGFDCSGFVYYVFHKFGVETGHSTSNLALIGYEVPFSEARIGDIIVFTGTNSTLREPGHAGIIISKPDEPLTFMHSSSSKNHYGVTTTIYAKSNYAKRFLQIRRIAQVK